MIEIQILERGKVEFSQVVEFPVDCGRQDKDEDGPYHFKKMLDRGRLVIAPLKEIEVPRHWFLVEPLNPGNARITNATKQLNLPLQSGIQLIPGQVMELPLPFTIAFGFRQIRITGTDNIQSLAESTIHPVSLISTPAEMAHAFQTMVRSSRGGSEELNNEKLCKLIQMSISLLQSLTGTADFLPAAAKAIVESIRLDSGRVLQFEEHWKVSASHFGPGHTPHDEWMPSRSLLAKVTTEKKVAWMSPRMNASESVMRGGMCAVAAPLFDPAGQIIGILYGERSATPMSPELKKQEVLFVEMVAWGLALGQARLDMEKQAHRAEKRAADDRVLMQQFFTAELARQLQESPDLLVGRDAEVTLLNCDIRGFSALCANKGAEYTLKWLNDLLGELSQCVLDEQGVLVDYVGDELMAMWGAPKAQPDQAMRACRAALAMLASIRRNNEKHGLSKEDEIRVTIGISSGSARVGNVGSHLKFKYGALGNTVNLASRVQGATRYLKTSVLMTEPTAERLDSTFCMRRVAVVKVVNIPDPVTVYELSPPGRPGWADLKHGFEEALKHFEREEFNLACRNLGSLLSQPDHRNDGPSLVLLNRSVDYLLDPPSEEKPFDPVWKLSGK